MSDTQAHTHGSSAATLTRNAALASTTMAVALIVLKGWASWETHAVSMLGSLADSSLDLLASLVTLFAVRLSAQPADEYHGFGHGKAEALAALFQTSLFIVSAVLLGWRAFHRLGSDALPEAPSLGIGVSLVAMLFTLILVQYQKHVVKRTGSVAIEADHVHYSSDLLLNGSVIAALLLGSQFGITSADPLFGIAIAAWLLLQARGIARRSIDQLMDKEWPLEKRQRLIALAESHPAISGVHDLRTRTSGVHDFVQFHVWVDPDMTVAKAHRIMDEVEEHLAKEFPGVEILIHTDPEGLAEPGQTSAHHA